jgi:hypothetical protein
LAAIVVEKDLVVCTGCLCWVCGLKDF